MIRLMVSTIAALAAPRPLQIDKLPHPNARVHEGEEHLATMFENRDRYVHQSFTGRKSPLGWYATQRESSIMKPYAAVTRKVWVNSVSGRTAPGSGACPVAIGSPDFCNWKLEPNGYTVRNRRAGTDAGVYPTLEAAQAQAAWMNGDRPQVAG